MTYGWGLPGYVQDLLENEKALRDRAEQQNRAFRELLYELACRLDGKELEELRRLDPNSLERWGADEWRRYFSKLCIIKVSEVERLLRELQELREKLAQIGQIAAHSPAPAPEAAFAHTGHTRAEELSCPPQLSRFFTEVTQKQRKRIWQILTYLAQGKSIRAEILLYVARREGISEKAGNLRRCIEMLEKKGYIIGHTLEVAEGKNLAVLELSNKGRELIKALGLEMKESEYERIKRLHERQPGEEKHTALLLALTLEARRRGLEVEVLPPYPPPYAPDMRVGKFYVEVERGLGAAEARDRKWILNREANFGIVVFGVQSDEVARRLLQEEISPPFLGTALESLLAQKSEDFWLYRSGV